MQVLVGTSGYSYKEWKGTFYPEDLKPPDMLRYYAERLTTVEINNTFYRMPNASLLENWSAQVPEAFVFVLKGSQRITHMQRLKNAGESVAYLFATAATLGPKLGPVFFQLPPSLKKDVPRLAAFLELLPSDREVAFEFRHDSWLDEEVYARLRARNFALCVADTEERSVPVIATADFAYLRLRDEGYDDEAIRTWTALAQDLSTRCRDVFVYFKHEDAGKGAAFGQRMIELLAQG